MKRFLQVVFLLAVAAVFLWGVTVLANSDNPSDLIEATEWSLLMGVWLVLVVLLKVLLAAALVVLVGFLFRTGWSLGGYFT